MYTTGGKSVSVKTYTFAVIHFSQHDYTSAVVDFLGTELEVLIELCIHNAV